MRTALLMMVCFFWCAGALTATQQGATTQKMYRYKNKDGVVVIKDHLPPDVARQGYDIVDIYGNLIRRVPPAKTPEQIRKEKELARLAAIERQKIEEQLRRDNELLRQYTTVRDLERARDNMIKAVMVDMDIRRANIQRIRRDLEKMQSEAADFERRGKPIPKALQDNIERALRQIAEGEMYIERKNAEIARIREEFSQDIARFEELQRQRARRLAQDEAERQRLRNRAFYCEDFNVCARAWQLAQLYVKDNASGRIELITDTLIITEKPRTDKDVSITVSRIPERDGRVEIHIDVYCKGANGEEQVECTTDRAQQIVRRFVPYLRSRLEQSG